jgi:hypothetical protein
MPRDRAGAIQPGARGAGGRARRAAAGAHHAGERRAPVAIAIGKGARPGRTPAAAVESGPAARRVSRSLRRKPCSPDPAIRCNCAVS